MVKTKILLELRDGSGPDLARPEARPEGVLVDPDPSRAIFGGPETFFFAARHFFLLKMLI